ncbi:MULTISPECIES: TIGR00341 family protein [unclassified Meridianimarinicoccus]|uniref:TIGR00341 family protein n=1 Tax=unclassified Meridianimarinicoccus TaxID=2923344 RepID=UPI00186781FD|nr:TIGR00341 family protein [Fluviibacterium sp. MJW13]
MRLIILSLPNHACDKIFATAKDICDGAVMKHREDSGDKTRWTLHILADDDCRQNLLDAIQTELDSQDGWRLAIVPVDTSLPRKEEEEEEDAEPDPEEEAEKAMKLPGGLSREEIYEQVEKQGRIDRAYLVFVLLSTVVAAFGMLEDNVPVVLGAMVIAPLLGPNLALSVGVALGDGKLILRSAAALVIGTVLSIALGFVIGLLMPISDADELLSRTDIGFDGLAIALASGAAAALSLVTGVSSALVGVMVAVALLPPATAIGLFLGFSQGYHALEAGVMLLMNIVCINLSAQAVMLTRGITPRRWYEKKRAKRHSLINGAIWLSLLVILAILLWLRQPS